MHNPDAILRYLLAHPNAYQSDILARHLNISHNDFIHLFNLINDRFPNWFKMKDYMTQGIYFLRLDHEKRTREIELFLENGGWVQLEKEANQKAEMENETLKLVKAQQKEIEDNKKQTRFSNRMAIAALVISIVSILIAIGVLLFGDKVLLYLQ